MFLHRISPSYIEGGVARLLLTPEEKEIMAEENYSLIYFAANMFKNTGIHVDELAGVASVGFTKALNAFDKSRNIRFSTYSVNCMKNEILFYLRKEKKHTQNTVSMNYILASDNQGNELSMEDIVSSETKNVPTIQETVELDEDVQFMYQSLKYLNENERYIAIYRFGLFDEAQKTQREIAEEIGMSQANVSKIEKNIMKKLKKIMEKKFNVVGF